MITLANYLKLAHLICAINLTMYAWRELATGFENSMGWLTFALMYACMEVNVTQDQYRIVRAFCATLAMFITGALALA